MITTHAPRLPRKRTHTRSRPTGAPVDSQG